MTEGKIFVSGPETFIQVTNKVKIMKNNFRLITSNETVCYTHYVLQAAHTDFLVLTAYKFSRRSINQTFLNIDFPYFF